MKKGLLYILFFFAFFLSRSQSPVHFLKITEFRYKGNWYPAKIPANIYLDLFRNKLIPDPFYADNENKLQWIADSAWTYRIKMNLGRTLIEHNDLELIITGIDPFTKVWFNGHLLLESKSSFIEYRASIKNYLQNSANEITVELPASYRQLKILADQLPYTLPGENKVLTRKPQYHYGWDFAPKFTAGGIGDLRIEASGPNRITEVNQSQQLYKDSAIVIFDIDCESEKNTSGLLSVLSNENETIKKEVELKKGKNRFQVRYKINQPKLWWCNGLGEPALYNFSILLSGENFREEKKLRIGLRKVALKHEKDSNGTAFTFYLNDKPVFIKGANYVPQDVFTSRTEKNNYHQMAEMAKRANMNMLRVWGGGVYPDEAFYEACDKNGVLVWQDFMFACAMYPGDSAFLNNVKHEVQDQVLRLRNHPSLALWCGNNENIEGWYNWGWQKQYNYSKKDSTEIIHNYQKLFQEIIPQTIKENSSDFNYWPSSPQYGWGRKENLKHGDSHYWGVWWGEEPFKKYEEKVGRFMSEYGFQSYPALSTVKKFCDSSLLDPVHTEFQNHQKHPKGFQIIQNYLERDYKTPHNLQDYIYVTQLVQLKGMQTAIEAHRRAKPYCMGTMFWQLNDCWPGITWSAIDYYKTPKAFYYHLDKLYDDILLSVKEDSTGWSIFIVSDKPDLIKGDLKIRVQTLDMVENILYTKKAVQIAENSSSEYFHLKKTDLKNKEPHKIYLKCELVVSGKTHTKLFYFVPPKDLLLSNAEIKYVYNAKKKSISLMSPVLQKNVFISINDGATILSDNFFDLEGGPREISILSKEFDIKTLKILSLNNLN